MTELGLTLVYLQIFHFVLAVIFTFRLSYMMVYEEGIFGLMSRLRALARITFETVTVPNQLGQAVEVQQPTSKNWIGKGLICFNCTSIWVALIPAIFLRYPINDPVEYPKIALWVVMYVFTISGGAIILKGLLK